MEIDAHSRTQITAHLRKEETFDYTGRSDTSGKVVSARITTIRASVYGAEDLDDVQLSGPNINKDGSLGFVGRVFTVPITVLEPVLASHLKQTLKASRKRHAQ